MAHCEVLLSGDREDRWIWRAYWRGRRAGGPEVEDSPVTYASPEEAFAAAQELGMTTKPYSPPRPRRPRPTAAS